jgi:glyoxylase-like metal-dependent hydrolase (beta-lactamase superfamily II)
MPLEHFRTQYAVGQGSFHAASVSYSDNQLGSWQFDYVYDCGALDGPRPSKAVEWALDHYEGRLEGPHRVIDALVLSHYDCDHINGAARLAASHQVRRIFLPYLSADELVLEVAKCASAANTQTLQALYAAAFGTQLWGAQVVRVVRGARPGEDGADGFRTEGGPPLPEPPRRPPEEREEDGEGGDARPFDLIVERTGRQLGGVLDDRDAVAAVAPGVAPVWRLKFWNYALADEELTFMAAVLLGSIGFPIESLEKVDGASTVLAWLEHKENREHAVAAYRAAITEYSGKCPPVAQVANLCSLALYSGETVQESWRGTYWCNDLSEWWLHRGTEFNGWLGTGDAILGRADVWADFATHYVDELPRLRTVLVPHHGAAPASGPAFYNSGLNPHGWIATVISAGHANKYGHPRSSVLKEIMRQRGLLRVLTEGSWPGFLEHITWD